MSTLQRSLKHIMLLSLLATASLGAQQPVIVHPDSSPPKHVAFTSTVEVPLVDPGIPNTTLPVVEVMINGRGPYRFGIETGAGFVGVGPGFGAKAGLTAKPGAPTDVVYQVDSLRLGEASFMDFPITELPRGATGVDGILGLPLFRDVLVTIDYAAKKLRISRDTLSVADGKSILELRRAGPFWTMPVEIAGKPMRGVLDTRGTGSFSMVPAIADQLPFEAAMEVIGRAGGAGIPTTEVKAGRLKGDVKIGDYTFTRPTITSRPLPAHFPTEPIVGDGVLRNFVVSLDQRTRRLRLARTGPAVIELPVPTRRPQARPQGDSAATRQ